MDRYINRETDIHISPYSIFPCYISMGSWGKHTKLDFHTLDDKIEQRTDDFKKIAGKD